MTLHDALSEPSAARFTAKGSGRIEGPVRALIQHAARTAPASLAERLEEEWLADLAARAGKLARLRFALGCCWATRVIAHELGVPERAAATTGDKNVAICTQAGHPFHSHRTTVSVLIVSLHILVIYGLATGMARRMLAVVPDRIQVSFIPKPTVRDPGPPVPGPTLGEVRIKPTPPRWQFDVTPSNASVDGMLQLQPQPPAGSPPLKPIDRVIGGIGPGFPSSADYYPDASRRLGEKGVAAVHVCVDAAGRLTADPAIAESSGSARLDGGALRLAKAGSGHYRPTTEDGRPVSECYPVRIRFDLKD